MIQVKNKLSKKDKQTIRCILEEIPDIYNDFYITSDNMRLFIAENSHLLFKNINKGDKIAFDKNGMAIITGFSDKAPRKYLKVLAKNKQEAYNLVEVLVKWNYNNVKLWAKLKSNNPLINILKKNGFKFFGSRGKENLFYREAKEEK